MKQVTPYEQAKQLLGHIVLTSGTGDEVLERISKCILDCQHRYATNKDTFFSEQSRLLIQAYNTLKEL